MSSWRVAGVAGALLLAACGGGGGGGGSGGGGGGGGTTTGEAVVVGSNDLGMHCMDRDFSVFSILPPFNVLQVQVLRPGDPPVLLDAADVDVFYDAVADATGSINSTSVDKTAFWDFAADLFGASLATGEGLRGLFMPVDASPPGPQPLSFDAAHGWFLAEGIPITPLDDQGAKNSYPLLRVSAFDRQSGRELAHTDLVVPVSQETDCQNCHATGEIAAQRSTVPWSTDPDREIQTRTNILILHDVDHGTALQQSTPVLCASCHYSPPLDLAGLGPTGAQVGLPTMSATMHQFHGQQLDGTGNPLFPANGTTEATCYQCHPGRITQCARGVMKTGGMECRNCHGSMQSVGGELALQAGGSLDGKNDGKPRRPWMDLPRCQSCHTGDALQHLTGPDVVVAADGMRLQQAFRAGDASASPIAMPGSRFAENPDTLFRFSKGHGGVKCEACHGSTHAEWPEADAQANDNVAAVQLQGHAGKLLECTVCHPAGTLPLTTGGPHGLHNVNDGRWIDENHGSFYRRDPQSCKACHGADLRGSPLSRVPVRRTLRGEDRTVTVQAGQAIGCGLCHSVP